MQVYEALAVPTPPVNRTKRQRLEAEQQETASKDVRFNHQLIFRDKRGEHLHDLDYTTNQALTNIETFSHLQYKGEGEGLIPIDTIRYPKKGQVTFVTPQTSFRLDQVLAHCLARHKRLVNDTMHRSDDKCLLQRTAHAITKTILNLFTKGADVDLEPLIRADNVFIHDDHHGDMDELMDCLDLMGRCEKRERLHWANVWLGWGWKSDEWSQYMPPELLYLDLDHPSYNREKGLVWMLGMLIYEMLSAGRPIVDVKRVNSKHDFIDQLESVLGSYQRHSLRYRFDVKDWEPLGHSMWNKGPSGRNDVDYKLVDASANRSEWTHNYNSSTHTIWNITQCPQASVFIHIAADCLQYDPAKRPSIEQLCKMCAKPLTHPFDEWKGVRPRDMI